MIKVLVADDHEMVRAGIRFLLVGSGDIKIVSEAADGMAAVTEYRRSRPDVVILDVSMPVMDGIDTCKRIKSLYPKAKILVLSVHDEEQYAVRMINAGASGYVNKRIDSRELQEAIRAVARGGIYLHQGIRSGLLSEMINNRERSDVLSNLSDRELQVFHSLALGKKMKDIAQELGLSAKTVDNYRARILVKLNLKRVVDLVAFAHQNNLV
jgi:two-component system invasion response regulator UvrY